MHVWVSASLRSDLARVSRRRRSHLDEGPLAEFLVDLRFVHDVLGSAGVLQRAQSLLHDIKAASLGSDSPASQV